HLDGVLDKSLEDPDQFFQLPHEARLAKVRFLSGAAEKMAKLIEYGCDPERKGAISEGEVFELTQEYLNSEKFKRDYVKSGLGYDGAVEHLRGRQLTSLWKIVPQVPESIGYLLLSFLPEQSGFARDVPEELLKQIRPKLLMVLLDRADVRMTTL